MPSWGQKEPRESVLSARLDDDNKDGDENADYGLDVQASKFW